jgi:hypothetical protein
VTVTAQFEGSQRPSLLPDATRPSLAQYSGLLGNQHLQAPTPVAEFETTVVWQLWLLNKGFATANPTSKLAALKSQHFTAEGRDERIKRSLAALAEPQTIDLTLQQWKEIVEEVEDEDED